MKCFAVFLSPVRSSVYNLWTCAKTKRVPWKCVMSYDNSVPVTYLCSVGMHEEQQKNMLCEKVTACSTYLQTTEHYFKHQLGFLETFPFKIQKFFKIVQCHFSPLKIQFWKITWFFYLPYQCRWCMYTLFHSSDAKYCRFITHNHGPSWTFCFWGTSILTLKIADHCP